MGKYYPPKDGKLPGLSVAASRAKRQLALEVQAQVGVEALVRFHVLRASRKAGARLYEDPDTGEISAVSDEDLPSEARSGSVPSDADVAASITWLSDRGHGMPAQSIQLQGAIRQQLALTTGTLPISTLKAGTIAALRALLAPPSPAAPAMIEAHAVEVPEESSSGDHPVAESSAE